jgi:hypothetical protein
MGSSLGVAGPTYFDLFVNFGFVARAIMHPGPRFTDEVRVIVGNFKIVGPEGLVLKGEGLDAKGARGVA